MEHNKPQRAIDNTTQQTHICEISDSLNTQGNRCHHKKKTLEQGELTGGGKRNQLT